MCVIFNSVPLDACREVKCDITNATGCMCVWAVHVAVWVSGGVSGSGVSVVFICSLFRVLMVVFTVPWLWIIHHISQSRKYFPLTKTYNGATNKIFMVQQSFSIITAYFLQKIVCGYQITDCYLVKENKNLKKKKNLGQSKKLPSTLT